MILWNRIKQLWQLSGIDLTDEEKRPYTFLRKRGAIYEPVSDIEEQRESILEENKAQGKDTPLSDLIPSDDNN